MRRVVHVNAVSEVVPRRDLRCLPAWPAVVFLVSFISFPLPARAAGDTARTLDDGPVIRVDSAVVTASEFQERLNLTPSGIQVPDPDAHRRLVAASLVAEKLFASQARRMRLDSSASARTAVAEMEKEAVYEEWMKQQITSRVRITPDDLRKALARFRQRRFVKYMVFPDSASASAARRSLRPGAGLDSVRVASGTPPVLSRTIDYAEALPQVEDLVFSLRPGQVGMYTCGPTVHDHPHIGNYRTFVWEDLLRRTLELHGFAVTQVMNITDVDDKTIRGARDKGLGLDEYTRPFIEAFARDRDVLNILPADHYPRATAHIPEMVALVQTLLRKGFAYRKDGSILYCQWYNSALLDTEGKMRSILSQVMDVTEGGIHGVGGG